MVRAGLAIIRTCKDDPTRHSAGREKTRKAEEEMGGQHHRMDRPKTEQVPQNSRHQTGDSWEVFDGVPTVALTTGEVKVI